MLETLWKRNIKNIPTFGKLTAVTGQTIPKVDVCVIGSGITGLSAALKLSEHSKVAVIEAGKVASGVSAYTTAKVSILHRLHNSEIAHKHGDATALDFVHLNYLGLEEIRSNIQKYKIDCDWREVSQYTYTHSRSEMKSLEKEVEILQKYGLKASIVDDIAELPIEIVGAVKLEGQGEFNSYKYCLGLIEELKRRNCLIFENSRVLDVGYATMPDHRVKCAEGAIDATHVIVATHLPILDRSGHFGLTSPSKSYCMAFNMREGLAPRDGYISTGEKLDNKSIRSAGDGKILIVAGCGHSQGEPPQGSTAACYAELERFGRRFKVSDMICKWSALDYYTADQLPYIGKLHHGTDTIFTATGYAKWGFTQGAASALVFDELIKNKTMPEWAKAFDARRWDLLKSTIQGIQYQLHVGKHYALEPLTQKVFSNLPDIESLVNDHGGLCKDKSGNVVGAYRDVEGKIHCVSPNCSHLGCRLAWSEGDKSWECPCHGSTFDVDGNVLHGPAVSNLKTY